MLEKALDASYVWVAKQRKHYPDDDSVWDLRKNWATKKNQLIMALTTGRYVFTQSAMMNTKAGSRVTVANAADACVLKTLALLLQHHLYGHMKKKIRPFHCQGMGGTKKAIRKVKCLIDEGYAFIFKTDIANYYASIKHELLYSRIRMLWKKPPAWVNLIYGAIKAGLYEAGHYYDTNIGIIKGSPLSYVLGSYFLSQLDEAFAHKKSVRYVRYMDDIVILTKTRSSLHRAIAICRRQVSALQLQLSHEKTDVGKSSKAFTFLGYRFNGAAAMLAVASQTITKSLARVTSLLEQQTLSKERLEKHVQGFICWAKGGLSHLLDPLQAKNDLLQALEQAGIFNQLAKQKQTNIKHHKWGKRWLRNF